MARHPARKAAMKAEAKGGKKHGGKVPFGRGEKVKLSKKDLGL